MMIIETREVGNQLTFKVEGRLTGAGVATLEDCWRTAAGVIRTASSRSTSPR